MSKKAMKLGFRVLERVSAVNDDWDILPPSLSYDVEEAINVLKEALAKQGEPVAWYVDFGNEHEPNYFVFGAKPDDEPTATVRPLVFGDTTPQPKQEQDEPALKNDKGEYN
jgi:hypothetical protein